MRPGEEHFIRLGVKRSFPRKLHSNRKMWNKDCQPHNTSQ